MHWLPGPQQNMPLRQTTIPVHTVYSDWTYRLISKLYLDLADFAVYFASPNYFITRDSSVSLMWLLIVLVAARRLSCRPFLLEFIACGILVTHKQDAVRDSWPLSYTEP
jgi:hypothetical protein